MVFLIDWVENQEGYTEVLIVELVQKITKKMLKKT